MKEMNLLPEEHLYAQAQKRKTKILISIVVALILLLIISYLSVYLIEYNMRKEIAHIRTEIQGMEKVRATQVRISSSQEILDSRIGILEKLDSERIDQYEFFKELEKALPNEILLDGITHPSGSYYNLTGETTKPDEIADFLVNLAKIEGVENVLLDNVNYGTADQQDSVPIFTINFTYQIEGGEENGSN